MMRIISGSHRRRQLSIPPAHITRPTTDKVRSAIFNLLTHRDWLGIPEAPPLPEETTVLDLFSGSGALALEAVSRGARRAWLVEHNPMATKILVQNIEALGMAEQAKLIRIDATRLPKAQAEAAGQCNLVFVDPPYGKGLIPPALEAAAAGGWLADPALIVGESADKEEIALPPGFTLLERRDYSDTAIWIWAWKKPLDLAGNGSV